MGVARPIHLHVSPDAAADTEAAAIVSTVAAAMDALDIAPDFELGLVLTTDAALQALNLEFRGQDKPTDVLSFPFDAADLPPGEPPYLGDIVISVAYAERNAASISSEATEVAVANGLEVDDVDDEESPTTGGWQRLDELKLLAVHGLLHLLGHDDETDEGAEDMRAEEVRLGVRR